MSEEIVEKQDYKLDELVKTYLTIRLARDNLARQFELKDAELKDGNGSIRTSNASRLQ